MPEGELTRNAPNSSNKKEIYLTGSLLGPPDTPYAGAKYHVDIIVVGKLEKIYININKIINFFCSFSSIRYLSI